MSGQAIASLPMYDWPQLRVQTDRFWSAIADRLQDSGTPAPDALDRSMATGQVWTSPGLVLSQTCGLPYVRELRGQVALVGTPDYRVPDCRPGWYDSVIVVRSGEPGETLGDFRGRRLAINGIDSQSGCQAILFAIAEMAQNRRFFGRIETSGGHIQTVQMIANGLADIGSIDHVTWRLAQKYVPEAARLRVLGHTPQTPGLPLITAKGNDHDAIAAAVRGAIADLAPGAENPLDLGGLWRSAPPDYEVIAERARIGTKILQAHKPVVAAQKESKPQTEEKPPSIMTMAPLTSSEAGEAR